MACHCSHFPDEHLQLHCSSAIIWVLDKTAWSTLVTLEIRIREISWQAIWEQSNQVSENSVGRHERRTRSCCQFCCALVYQTDGQLPLQMCSESIWTRSRMASKKQKKASRTQRSALHADVESMGIIVIRMVPVFIRFSDTGLNAALHSSERAERLLSCDSLLLPRRVGRIRGRWDWQV